MINTQTLQRAVTVAQQIESLQRELDAILGGGFSSSSSAPAKRGRKPKAFSFDAGPSLAAPQRKKRKLSAEAIEKIREGQRRRWAKVKGGKAAPKAEKPEAMKPAKKKSRMSPEGLQRIKDAQAKRWAAVRAKAKK